MDVEEKVTLTQRRALSGADKLDRTKLVGSSPLGDGNEDELAGEGKKGGSARIIIWILIIAILAGAAYLGLRTFLNRGSTPTPTPTPTATVEPTVNPADEILGAETLPDTQAAALQADSKFITGDQSVGEASESAYTVTDLLVQPYETFIRVEFTVVSDGEEPFPQTTALYATELNQISLTMSNVTEDTTKLAPGVTASFTSSLLESITHEETTGNSSVYLLTLSGAPKFILHTVEGASETEPNKVVLDIKESDSEVTPTPSGSVTPTTTVTPTTAGGLTNEYSAGDQVISADTTGNTVTITSYNYGDTTPYFNYNLNLTGGDKPWPNVTADYDADAKKITVTISNLFRDGIVGNGGSGSTDFASKGVRDVNKVTISNSANKSTYIFELDRALQYRMLIDEAKKQLRLEFKH
jgi:hypothetical protein